MAIINNNSINDIGEDNANVCTSFRNGNGRSASETEITVESVIENENKKKSETEIKDAKASRSCIVRCKSAIMMKIGICIVAILLCTAYISQLLLTPHIIEAVLSKSYHVNAQDPSLVSRAARVQSFMDALQCFLFLFIAPALGEVSDVYGRKLLIYAACLSGGFSYGFLILGYHYFWLWSLYVARTFGCLFTIGLFITSSLTYMSDLCSMKHKAKNFGYAMGAIGAGIAITPTLTGFVVAKTNMYVPLFGGCAVIFVAGCYALCVLPESLHYDYDVEQYIQQANQPRLPSIIHLLNPFRSIGVLFTYNSFVSWMSVVYILYYISDAAVISEVVMYTTYRYNWSTFQVGLVLSVNGFAMVICQGPILGLVTKHLGERKAVMMGFFASMCSHIIFAFAYKGWMFFVGEVIYSYAVTANPSIQALVNHNVPAEKQGLAISSLVTLGVLGVFCGGLLASNTFSYFVSARAIIHHLPGAHFCVAAVISIVCLVICAVLFARGKGVSVGGREEITHVHETLISGGGISEETPLVNGDSLFK